MKSQIWRQGDVTVIKVTALPADAVAVEHDGVLARGEVTGHAHRMKGQVRYFRNERDLFMEVVGFDARLDHEEHHSHYLKPGIYKVGIQKEWDWFSEEKRDVQD